MNVTLWIAVLSLVTASAKMYGAPTGMGPEKNTAHEKKEMLRRYSYYSFQGLQELMELDWRILRAVLGHVIDNSITRLNAPRMVEWFLYDWNSPRYRPFYSLKNITAISVGKEALNPLAIFRTLWRFEHYVKRWWKEGIPGHELGPGIQKIVRAVYNPKEGPTTDDLTEVTVGLLRIQQVYNLTAQEISEGLLVGTDIGVPLDANMSIALSQRASYLDLHDISVEWAEVAVRKVKDMLTGLTEAEMLRCLADDLRKAEKEVDVAKRMLQVHQKYVSEISEEGRNAPNSPMVIEPLYRQLCEGKIEQTAAEKRKLFCWLETQIHPSWKIGPLKAEFLSLGPGKPELVQYHDILIERLMHINFWLHDPRGEHTKGVVVKKTGTRVVDPMSKLCAEHFIDPEGPQGEAVGDIWRLVSRVTGLRIGGKRTTWMTAYTPGGHFHSHLDSNGYDLDKENTQVASYMFYLNNGEGGGETAFPKINVRVTPKKGSAIFWYNVATSGRGDIQTAHGSCPILFGQKIILFGMVSYSKQDHLRCDKDPERYEEILVNGMSKYARAA